jgi:hypothetical protein
VRRRIDALVARGWLRKDGRGDLFITELPYPHFEGLTPETYDDFVKAADAVTTLKSPINPD